MKTIVTSTQPCILYSNEDAAKKDAEEFGVEPVKVIRIMEWNNQVEQVCIGYGLYDNGKLLSTKDFTSI